MLRKSLLIMTRRSLAPQLSRTPTSTYQISTFPLSGKSKNLSSYRSLSSYSFNSSNNSSSSSSGSTTSLNAWPIRKINTILNIVPQGQQMVVERFGKLHTIHDSGYFFAIPIIDDIAYVVDRRERAIDIPPQSTITRDNVSVDVSGNLFVAFVDAEKAAYGATNPLYAVVQHAQSAMRSAIGEMELDEILHERARLNTVIKGSLQEAAVVWGIDVRRYEITEITPDPVIRLAMDKQAAAERARREQVLQAEGDKRSAELTSEGVKMKLMNESEGTFIKLKNEAEGEKIKILRGAEAKAESITLQAKAQASAIKLIAEQLQKAGGEKAATLALAKEYVAMYGDMGSKSNTLMFNERPADINALIAQASAALGAVQTNQNLGSSEISSQQNLIEADLYTVDQSPPSNKENDK